MNKDRIDTIINESMYKVLNEDLTMEKKKKEHHKDDDSSSIDDIVGLLSDFLHKSKNLKDLKKKKKLKRRKMAGGRSTLYDYDSYKKSNKELSHGDANTISRQIDTDKTNIASVARDIFPDHTEQGAQSQLRKIINGDRPMTNKVASKLDKLISMGKVAKK